MNLHPEVLLPPVFRWLDAVIEDYGLYIYLVCVWLSPFLIAWILRGGLRRKRTRRESVVVVPIVVIRAPEHPPPLPPIPNEPERRQTPSDDNDDSAFGA
jgi:hypothetical protein